MMSQPRVSKSAKQTPVGRSCRTDCHHSARPEPEIHPPQGINFHEAQNFISLVIGMLGDRTNPQGEAVRFARQLVSYLEVESG